MKLKLGDVSREFFLLLLVSHLSNERSLLVLFIQLFAEYVMRYYCTAAAAAWDGSADVTCVSLHTLL